MDALLERIQACTADCFSDTPFAEILASHAGISVRLAEEVISGHKPFTARMLEQVARATGTSAHWLLTGEGSMAPPQNTDVEDELKFLSAFRTADPLRQRYAVFILSFDGVMDRLPWEIRNRVLSGLLAIAEVGLNEHEWLRNAIGRCMVRHAVGMREIVGLEPMFTPVHEALGVFGPERPAGIDAYLKLQQ